MSTPDSEPRATAAESIERTVAEAVPRIDALAGAVAADRPPHLLQLNQILDNAVAEARAAEHRTTNVGRNADLWRLLDPGYLRSIVEYPVTPASTTIVLVPVLCAWLVLGIAEIWYVSSTRIGPDGSTIPFFNAWLDAPWFLGPIMLSTIIVGTVGWIMWRQSIPAREQRRADLLDDAVHRLEVDLRPHVTHLHAQLPIDVAESNARQAAADLSAAARQFVTATEHLSRSMPVVERLGTALTRLEGLIPQLTASTQGLGAVNDRLNRTAGDIASRTEPLTRAFQDVALAGDVARDASRTVDAASLRVDAVAAATADLEARAQRHAQTLAASEKHYTAAAELVSGAARQLDSTMRSVRETAGVLREAVSAANWMSLVVDGLTPTEAPRPGPAPTDLTKRFDVDPVA